MRGALASGAAGAAAVLVMYSVTGMSDLALFPWFEANQGFLSVLALAAALTFALIENHRANTASESRRAEYVDTVLELIHTMERQGEILRAATDESEREANLPDGARHEWGQTQARIQESVKLMRPSAPPDGPLALALAELVAALESPIYGREIGDVRASLAERERILAEAKAKVAARR